VLTKDKDVENTQQNINPAEMTNEQIIDKLAQMSDLENQIKATSEPLRKELLSRHMETGEVNIEHNGWVSNLKKEAVSAAWVQRQYGYPKEEIPSECFNEEIKIVLDGAKVVEWLTNEGFEVKPSYALAFGRKRSK